MDLTVCLIKETDGLLQVNPEAIEVLSKISQPVVVVSIVGLLRTGKSYLMNKLAGSQNGFAVGSTLAVVTKGIWMRCLPHPTKEGHTLVLLDTEGPGSLEKEDTKNDTWIFCLTSLLSSALIYNSKNIIDEYAIEKLHYVSEMSQFIKVKSKEDESEDESEDDYSRHFPTFIWTGRDVTLKRNLHGRPVTDDEFLENALTPRETIHNMNNVRNQYKECIRTYFKSRKCFMFDLPSGDNNVVQNMDKASDDQLSEGFKVQTNNFCDYIYENVDVKCVDDNNIVTGKILAKLVIMYTETICSSNAICVEHVVNSISMAENTRAVKEAIQHYKKKMEENVVFPTETLDEISEKEALEKFKKISFKDKDHQFQRQLAENIEKERRKFSERNDMESLNRCENLIEELSKDLERRSYARLGGYEMFMKEMKRIEEEYKKAPRKGNKAEEVFQKFKKSKLMIASNIKEFEKALEEKLKQEEEKTRKEEEERNKSQEETVLMGLVAIGSGAVIAAGGGGAAIGAGGGGAAAAITAAALAATTAGIGLGLLVGIGVTAFVRKNLKHK